jgi:hypothetical protein
MKRLLLLKRRILTMIILEIMALGSENKSRRREFQKVAGGSKWREKITTIAQAADLINIVRTKCVVKDNYINGKLTELHGYITWKTSTGSTESLKSYRKLVYGATA